MKFLFSDERARAKLADAKAANSNKRLVFKQLVQLLGKDKPGKASPVPKFITLLFPRVSGNL